LGLSAARAFLACGARIVVVGLEKSGGERAPAEFSGNAKVIFADAVKADTASEAITEAVKRNGTLDGLYHVAGGSGRAWGDGALHEVTDEGWRATLDLNLTSVFYSNRAAVRQFRAQGSGGSILNVGSVLSSSPAPSLFGTHAYAAAKAAVVGLTRTCAAKYAPDRIRFNVLTPGLVATPMSQRAQIDPVIMSYTKTKQPLDGGRIGVPQDLDAAAVFFMSDASKFVTGQVLAVDGGWSVSEGALPARGEPA
jgi:NAD(P)-dependent dehydrogenase (short-subunit alcohol dehydrogenase family)